MNKPKPKPLIGIDISSSSVKVLELKKDGQRYKVDAYANMPLPSDAVVEKNIVNTEAVGETLRKALKKSGTNAKYAALAVPSSAVITKVIQLPASLPEDEMEAQIKEEEAAKYIPSYNPDEVNLDFELQGPSEADDSLVDVLLAASRVENVDARLAVAEMAKITPAVVDIESYAIEHCYPLLQNEMPEKGVGKTIAIIDVGSTMTGIHIIESGQLIYTREQNFGGKQLTEEIMRRYGMAFEEAEEAKREGSLPDADNYNNEVLDPFKEIIAQQISRLLQFFYSASSYDYVDQVLLGGGCASITNIDDLVAERIGAPVAIANPFSQIKVSGKLSKAVAQDAPSLLIACGLALRSFN